jgi:peptidoglycan/LPS O-acetylase OafA/YrhL/lysophospholipase L1-like esterase
LRFIAAFWVLLSHIGPPPIHFTGGLAGSVLHGLYNNLFCGVAAVIVFFIISGFCIHYPFRGERRFDVASYLARRTLRIGIPLLAVSIVAWVSGFRFSVLEFSILWSLYLELIYYAVYPFLRRLRRRWGWEWLTGAAYAGALLVVVSHPPQFDYHSYGIVLNAVLGLPCWLLGCILAEMTLSDTAVSRRTLWLLRCSVWAVSSTTSILRFHTPVGYPWTLNLFAILAAFWLLYEIRWRMVHPPQAWMEWAGQASYSIYLLHFVTLSWYQPLRGRIGGEVLDWLGFIAFSLGLCGCFYLCVERPSHLLAQRIGAWLKPDAPPWKREWKIAGGTILALLALATVFLAFHAYRRGGASYLQSRFNNLNRDWLEPHFPEHRDALLFIGDSLVERGDWSELLSRHHIRNRGRGGAGTDEVFQDLGKCPRTAPSAVFIMVGINDLLRGRNVAEIAEGYGRILDALKQRYPTSRICVQSVLPVNPDLVPGQLPEKLPVAELNKRLRSLSAQAGMVYVDLYATFCEKDGKLNPSYTMDGVHLNSRGYALWKTLILPIVGSPPR